MLLFDSWDPRYKSKFGAIRRNSNCTFTVRIPKDLRLDCPPVMVLFRSGFRERFLTLSRIREEADCIAYSADYSPNYSGVHYYYFSYTVEGQRSYIKRSNGHESVLNDGDLFQLTVYDETLDTPGAFKGGVMYQIFPDRFCKSGIAHKDVPQDRVLRDDWGGTPFYKPDEHGHVWNNDYFGGDLEGIRQKLPYLKDLGVTCLYLNPIFESHENHRYNTANYLRVDPLLGTNDDFKVLCEEAKQMGIRILLDGVFSHTGADSIYFNKFGRYGNGGAYHSKESPYYPWYSFFDYPNGYEAWWGIDTLPNVNENNPAYTEFVCGDDGLLRYWLSMGASGYRLDVADELPDQFLENLHTCVKGFGKDKLIIGEVWEDASTKESYGVKRRYLLGDQLDSVMNYPFRDAILRYVQYGDANHLQGGVMTILENYPKPSIDVLMNFVSTHDIERAITRLGGDPCDHQSKDWMAERWLTPEQYCRGKQLLQCAMVLQFFLPGIPCIYYGDEVGLQGYRDPFNRRCFPWGAEDWELHAFVKELSAIRRCSSIFADGRFRFLSVNENTALFLRYRKSVKKAVLIALNRTDQPQEVSAPILEEYGSVEVLHGARSGSTISLPPFDYAAIALVNDTKADSAIS